MRILLAAAFALVLAGVAYQPAQADPYPWCAQYGGARAGSSNCYFRTIGQCRAALSGNGGFCVPNPFYDGRPVRTPDEGVPRRRRYYY